MVSFHDLGGGSSTYKHTYIHTWNSTWSSRVSIKQWCHLDQAVISVCLISSRWLGFIYDICIYLVLLDIESIGWLLHPIHSSYRQYKKVILVRLHMRNLVECSTPYCGVYYLHGFNWGAWPLHILYNFWLQPVTHVPFLEIEPSRPSTPDWFEPAPTQFLISFFLPFFFFFCHCQNPKFVTSVSTQTISWSCWLW